jgi:hypothetical protein
VAEAAVQQHAAEGVVEVAAEAIRAVSSASRAVRLIRSSSELAARQAAALRQAELEETAVSKRWQEQFCCMRAAAAVVRRELL